MPKMPAHTFAETTTVLPAYELVALPCLRIQVAGKEYTIPAMPADTAGLLERAIQGDSEAIAALGNGAVFYRHLLGPTYDEMCADHCPAAAIDRAALTALADYQYGRIHAESVWSLGSTPEMQKAFIAATRAIYETSAEGEPAP